MERDKIKDQQMRDANYEQLILFLNEREERAGSQLFKAVLYAMDGMTIFYQTKGQAIKRASSKFNLTQKSIKSYIDEMGIVSQRAVESQGGFGRERFRQAGQLNSRLNREKD